MQQRGYCGRQHPRYAQGDQRQVEGHDKPVAAVDPRHQRFTELTQRHQLKEILRGNGDVGDLSGDGRAGGDGNAGIRLGVIYFAYFAFLTSALISYFVNYRQTLLGADQRNYVVTVYFQTANIVKILLQIALVCYVGSLYLWIAIELTFGILYSFILNWKINRVYPWLKCSVSEGRLKYPENRIIVRKARQMFVHKLAGMGRTQLLPFLVYAFTSLKLVAYYGNYMLLLTKLNQFVDNFLGSTGAGVGSLIAEGDMKRIQQVFWELSSLRFLIASFQIGRASCRERV